MTDYSGFPADKVELFWSRVDRNGDSECWPWTGSRNVWGYGRMVVQKQTYMAHRLAFSLTNGEPPAATHLDHQCHNRSDCTEGVECRHRRCCNPAHLQVVSRVENVMRGKSIFAQNARKTHCSNGHEFTPENTDVTYRGGRRCKTCAGLTGRGQGWSAAKTHCLRGHPYTNENTHVDSKGRRTCRVCRRKKKTPEADEGDKQ